MTWFAGFWIGGIASLLMLLLFGMRSPEFEKIYNLLDTPSKLSRALIMTLFWFISMPLGLIKEYINDN